MQKRGVSAKKGLELLEKKRGKGGGNFAEAGATANLWTKGAPYLDIEGGRAYDNGKGKTMKTDSPGIWSPPDKEKKMNRVQRKKKKEG